MDKRITSAKFWLMIIIVFISMFLTMVAASIMDVIIHKEFIELATYDLLLLLFVPITTIAILVAVFFAGTLRKAQKGGNR